MPHDPTIYRVRRLVLAAMLADGSLPRPEQFERAGLPPLVPAEQISPPPIAEAADWRQRARRAPGPSF